MAQVSDTTLVEEVRRSLRAAGAEIERIADDSETVTIWFSFVVDPVDVTEAIRDLRLGLAQRGMQRMFVSYLRLV